MLKITIDSREQTPWHFDAWEARTEIGKLDAGDYALTGDSGFAIERKSLDDFAGTIGSGWERFLREIDRMERYPAKIVIVEGSFSDLVFREIDGEIVGPDHSHYRITPRFAMKRLAELYYKGVSVVFAECSEYAAAICYALLLKRKREISGTGNQS